MGLQAISSDQKEGTDMKIKIRDRILNMNLMDKEPHDPEIVAESRDDEPFLIGLDAEAPKEAADPESRPLNREGVLSGRRFQVVLLRKTLPEGL